MTKDLQEKAIDFKGKKYVLVSDRVNYFNTEYPNGSIQTQLISDPLSDMVVVKAIVCPDVKDQRVFTGYSQAKWSDTQSFVNKTSALENCETSAVGRALAFMGIGVIESIASIDEIHKSERENGVKTSNTTEPIREPINPLTVKCGVCGEIMIEKSGINKDGKKWHGYFCPKSTKENNHPPRFI